jgi:DNA-binding MarR family transcriptional regulator
MSDPGPHSSATTGDPGDALDRDLGWAVGVFSRSYRKVAMGAVEDLPAGPRGYHLLCAVAEGPPRSQLALARHLDVDKTVMTYLLDDLEKAGMIVRQADLQDRRVRLVALTPAGSQALDRARHHIAEAESALMSGLSVDEIDTVRQLLARLAKQAQINVAQLGGAVPDCTP